MSLPSSTATRRPGASRTDWFDVSPLAPGVRLVAEPGHVNCFLIEGERSAILFDTGLGILDIRKHVESLTDKPVLAVNSHYHFDHTGGNRYFDEFAIHRIGAPLVAADPPEGLAEGYMAYTARLLKAFGPYREADDLYFHLLTAERMVRPLPSGFDPASYRIVPTVPTRLLDEGDVLDLGGRRLEVMHTPGHAPDCICLFDAANGLLFGGDTINTGPIYAQLEDSNLKDFERSTARLAAMADNVKRVFVCHFGRMDEPASFLGEVAEGFARLNAGEVELGDNVDCLNYPVKEARFDHFSIFVPAGDPVKI